jgi:hypothetical protein
MNWKLNVLAFPGTLILAASAAAQMPPDPALLLSGGPPQGKSVFTMRIDGMDSAPVKGAPFCATVVTEHTQTLSDGNRIHTTDNSMLCRDSEGRTRRESALNLLGAAPQTSSPKLITIVDPVASVRYLLDAENKIAQKMPLMPVPGPDAVGPPGPGKSGQVMIYQRTDGPGSDVAFNSMSVKRIGPDPNEPAPTTESLGDQTIDGIHVTGTRVTTTIPAGKMGNEKPIVITSERWYSSELKATIMTKHNDPWAGELKTEFTNVNTAEPDLSLFAVPASYKIIDIKENGPIKIQLTAPGSGAQ